MNQLKRISDHWLIDLKTICSKMSKHKTFRMTECKTLSIDHNNRYTNKIRSQILMHSFLMIKMIINIRGCRDKVK